jgi:hypothetical protein
VSEINVGLNRPRLLEPGAPPPPELTAPAGPAPDPFAAPAPYWTADKAAKVMAEGGKALSKLYGPDFRLSGVEVDLVGQPLANVLNDWVALPSGPQGDRIANLLALLAVVALLVAFRLPDILDAHDLLPRWAWSRRERERARRTQNLAGEELEPEPAPRRRREPEPSPEEAGSEPPRRDWSRYGPTTVGGGQLERAG